MLRYPFAISLCIIHRASQRFRSRERKGRIGDERVRVRLSETLHSSIRQPCGGGGDRTYWSGVIALFVCFYAVAENNFGAANRVENLPLRVHLYLFILEAYASCPVVFCVLYFS